MHKKPLLMLDVSFRNPLTGLIFRATSGAPMTRIGTGSHNPHATLRCSDRRCTTVAARLDVVERYTIKALGEWLEKYKLKIKQGLPTVVDFGANERALNAARAELEKVEKQIANTYDLLEQQVYDIDTFRARNQTLAHKKSDLTAEIARIRYDIDKAEENRLAYNQIVPRIMNVLNTYYALDNNEDRNALLKSVIEKITYSKEAPNRKGEGTKATFTLEIIPRMFRE